jgi:hypothetical protein
MNYAIKVTSTWTKKESLFPALFNDISKAEEKKRKLIDKCSLTGKFKNCEYSIVTVN